MPSAKPLAVNLHVETSMDRHSTHLSRVYSCVRQLFATLDALGVSRHRWLIRMCWLFSYRWRERRKEFEL